MPEIDHACSVVFSRTTNVAEQIERLLGEGTRSLDAAVYRFNNPRLAQAFRGLADRGSRIRIVVDRSRYDRDAVTRELLNLCGARYKLSTGRPERLRSKMHHKFAVLDRAIVLTGSYNWTLESDENNFDNLLIVYNAALALEYTREFEAIWEQAENRS